MIRFIFYFILLILFIWLGVLIHRDPGYILIAYQHWSVETTLWFAIIALIIFYILLYLLLKILRGTFLFPEKWHIWSKKRQRQKSDHLTQHGLCELAEGEWKNAEQDLVNGAHYNTTPLINYLAAACAAQQQNKYEARDNYLSKAHQSAPQAEMATGLTQAQLQYNAKQWELALATLRHLQQLNPNHPFVLKLLKNIYFKLHDWESLQALLPELKKHRVLSSEELPQIERLIFIELLKNKNNSLNVQQLWQQLPKNIQHDPQVIAVYAKFLTQQKEFNKAENLIREALKRNWDSELVNIYGKLPSDSPDKHLAQLENWLKAHPNDPELLLAAGRACIENNSWGKAQDYLTASLKLQPKAETYIELAKLSEHQNNPQAAIGYYKKSLLM